MNYIESTDNLQGPPPYAFKGVKIHASLLPADLIALQAVCDRFFNISPDHHFRAMVPFVYAAVSDYPRMAFGGHEDFGFTSQHEYFFMVPVLRFQAFGRILLPVEPTWIFPFIGVDNPTSAFSGREVLGYPKTLGQIDIGTGSDGAFAARVAMPSFTHRGPDAKQELLEIVRFDAVPGTAPPTGSLPSTILDGDLIDLLEDAALDMMDLFTPGLTSVVNMQQLRDGERPTQSAYTALIRSDWDLSNLSPIDFFDGSVTVTDNATIRIAETLGLSGGEPDGLGLRFASPLSFAMTTDMVFGDVTRLFHS